MWIRLIEPACGQKAFPPSIIHISGNSTFLADRKTWSSKATLEKNLAVVKLYSSTAGATPTPTLANATTAISKTELNHLCTQTTRGASLGKLVK
ncbi:hypothetical protein AFLA_001073 [Aspergillus flavus NRRL3357]|nr:hypothetical protein AFLA_001073 [Aspergillus flavus NRRL3357]